MTSIVSVSGTEENNYLTPNEFIVDCPEGDKVLAIYFSKQ